MMVNHSEPKLLYAVNDINAYHIVDGKEECLTSSGPQTLSLLMVPTSSPFAEACNASAAASPEQDFYLHLHLPPELDLPLPATTQIYHQPPCSYLIPRWDLGPDSGSFTRIEFPSKDVGRTQDDIDTFETIIAQCTAFLERSAPPSLTRAHGKEKGGEKVHVADELPPYDPSAMAPGEGYVRGSSSANRHGQIVLVDEENGSVVGELGEGFNVVESSDLKMGSKDPVEITLPGEGSQDIQVTTAPNSYLEMAMHPAYKDSFLVAKSAMASRFIVTTTGYVSKGLTGGAETFTQKTKPLAKPMTFAPTTHARVRKVHTFSAGAAGLSAKTVGQVTKVAQNFGATLTRRGSKEAKGFDAQGNPIDGYKPGFLNRSMMAFSTIADGVEQAGKNLMNSSSAAATTVVGHRYGAEAGEVTRNLGGGVTNVGLVYIDAVGVSRRAILKSVAKGMVVGKVKGGGDVVVSGADGNTSSGSQTPALRPGQARTSRSTSPAPSIRNEGQKM